MPGFRVSTSDKGKLDDKFYCGLCELLLREPIQTSCGHMYCYSCCFVSTTDVNCVKDGTVIREDETFHDKWIEREVLCQNVGCTNQDEGCTWRGMLSHLEDHEKRECKFLVLPCVYDACRVLVRRGELAEHLEKNCIFRPEKCQFCDEVFDYCRIKEHLRLNHNYLHCQMDNLGIVVDNLHQSVYQLQDEQHGLREAVQQLQEHLDGQLLADGSRRPLATCQDPNAQERTVASANLSSAGSFSGTPRESNGSVQNLAFAQRVASLEKEAADIKMVLESLKDYVGQQDTSSYDGQLLWKISGFSRKRNDAVNGEEVSVVSPSFSTSRYGYKMCARVYLNGDGMGRGTHISVYFVIMRGHYDALLRWPFRQKVTFMLLDQDDVEHVIDSIRPDPNSSSFQRPRRETNVASGCPMFCSLAELNNHAYVRDDTMFVKIIVDTDDL